jgi:hypothetical protein
MNKFLAVIVTMLLIGGCSPSVKEKPPQQIIDSLITEQTHLRWTAQSAFYTLGRECTINAMSRLLLRQRETGQDFTKQEIENLCDSLANYHPVAK